jgi:hypothetical protein
VPVISRFHGITINMHWDEHAPPHFHASSGEHDAAIAIRELEVIAGRLPRRALALTLRWAATHRLELMENWDLCRAARAPKSIPGLE